AGLLMSAGGAFLEGRAGDIKRQRLNEIAKRPGVDVDALTKESLDSMLKYLPQGEELSGKIGAANQRTLSAQEEAELPGIGAARQKALGQVSSLFDDDATWLEGGQRGGAGRVVWWVWGRGVVGGVGGGGGGGWGAWGAGRLGTLRMSDREKMARTQLGTG